METEHYCGVPKDPRKYLVLVFRSMPIKVNMFNIYMYWGRNPLRYDKREKKNHPSKNHQSKVFVCVSKNHGGGVDQLLIKIKKKYSLASISIYKNTKITIAPPVDKG